VKTILAITALVLSTWATGLFAQAQAGATGQCKDGTYTTAASKAGACSGHKGVQTWYASGKPEKATPANQSSKSAATTSTAAGAASNSKTTGQCKDGTYTTASAAAGACSGHKGIQSWYSTDAQPSAAPASAATPSAVPRPGSTPSMPPQSQPASSANDVAQGGGPGMVWVNLPTKVYHCPGNEFYGKTKNGKYMTEAEAKAMGARPDHNKPCS